MTQLTEKYGSEGRALDQMVLMTDEQIKNVAVKSGLIDEDRATIGG